ncbi:MAG TPA: M23 family metallopeptidase [Luteimonas sp.]|nr:M23 family metallopeptidase [Luteimonas sp.]
MTRGARLPVVAALVLAAVALVDAQAAQVYRWTDAEGRTHYTDRVDQRVPAGQVTGIEVVVEAAAVARLRVEAGGDGALAFVDNLLAGPIEVMLHADGGGPWASDPPLPARATVPPHSGALLARIVRGNPRLRVVAVPGTPNARPRDVEYAYPLQTAALRVQQAWGGSYSHADDENRHAVDFAAPVGTPVLAARDGTVMQTEARFGDASPDDEDDDALAARANFIRILHDDGTMALYAHLRPGGVLVRDGQRVRRGQQIGLSGNTGRSTAPHLHFVVQANRGMRLESVPFRMFGPQGILRFTPP